MSNNQRIRTKNMSLTISCPIGVSPPKEDTVALAKLSSSAKGKSFIDIGTGSGYVGIYASKKGKGVIATDVNLLAIKTAKKNSKANKVEIDFVVSDLFDALKGEFDIIAFNPPLSPSTSNFFTSLIRKIALARVILGFIGFYGGKEDRLNLIRKFIDQSRRHLKSNGSIFLVAKDKKEIERFCKDFDLDFSFTKYDNISIANLKLAKFTARNV